MIFHRADPYKFRGREGREKNKTESNPNTLGSKRTPSKHTSKV